MTSLSGNDVAEQLRRAVRGEVPVRLADASYTWDEAQAGNVAFDIGGWRIIFFNDCDELDYCDSAISSDGRSGEFDDWTSQYDKAGNVLREWSEPTDILSREEGAALEKLLKAAR